MNSKKILLALISMLLLMSNIASADSYEERNLAEDVMIYANRDIERELEKPKPDIDFVRRRYLNLRVAFKKFRNNGGMEPFDTRYAQSISGARNFLDDDKKVVEYIDGVDKPSFDACNNITGGKYDKERRLCYRMQTSNSAKNNKETSAEKNSASSEVAVLALPPPTPLPQVDPDFVKDAIAELNRLNLIRDSSPPDYARDFVFQMEGILGGKNSHQIGYLQCLINCSETYNQESFTISGESGLEEKYNRMSTYSGAVFETVKGSSNDRFEISKCTSFGGGHNNQSFCYCINSKVADVPDFGTCNKHSIFEMDQGFNSEFRDGAETTPASEDPAGVVPQ
jgi:hypothetical protein